MRSIIAVLLLSGGLMAQATYRKHDNAVLNDVNVTPGAVRQECTAVEICSPEFRTKPIRAMIKNFPKLKKQACEQYGIEKCDGSYEGDHLISIELCGCPDCLTNIWPEPYHPISADTWEGGAKDKDVVENKLHKWVCEGGTVEERESRLIDAQKWISTDWYDVYLKIKNGEFGQ